MNVDVEISKKSLYVKIEIKKFTYNKHGSLFFKWSKYFIAFVTPWIAEALLA